MEGPKHTEFLYHLTAMAIQQRLAFLVQLRCEVSTALAGWHPRFCSTGPDGACVPWCLPVPGAHSNSAFLAGVIWEAKKELGFKILGSDWDTLLLRYPPGSPDGRPEYIGPNLDALLHKAGDWTFPSLGQCRTKAQERKRTTSQRSISGLPPAQATVLPAQGLSAPVVAPPTLPPRPAPAAASPLDVSQLHFARASVPHGAASVLSPTTELESGSPVLHQAARGLATQAIHAPGSGESATSADESFHTPQPVDSIPTAAAAGAGLGGGWVLEADVLVVDQQQQPARTLLKQLIGMCKQMLVPIGGDGARLEVLPAEARLKPGHVRLRWDGPRSFNVQVLVQPSRGIATAFQVSAAALIQGGGGGRLSSPPSLWQGEETAPRSMCVTLAHIPTPQLEWRQPLLAPESLVRFAVDCHDAVMGSGASQVPMNPSNGHTHGLLPGTWLWLNADCRDARRSCSIPTDGNLARRDTWFTAVVLGEGPAGKVLLAARPQGRLGLHRASARAAEGEAADEIPLFMVVVDGWQKGAMVPAIGRCVGGAAWETDESSGTRSGKRPRQE